MRAAALSVLAGAALAVPAAPAVAASCAHGGGVTVVVDFASLGGGRPTRCAAGDPTSGVAALRGAGFAPTRAAQEPGYFLCRIDGKPANDPCQRTSPADAYWSYWHAKPGGSWTYSAKGPADYDPAPGTVEGWAFGAGKPPSVAPPQEQPAPAAPAPAPSPRPAVAPAPTRAPAFPATPAPSTAATRPTAPAPAAVATPATSASASPSPVDLSSPQPGAVPPAPVDAPPAASARGSAAAPLAAVGVIALLAVAGGVAAVRRRRDQP